MDKGVNGNKISLMDLINSWLEKLQINPVRPKFIDDLDKYTVQVSNYPRPTSISELLEYHQKLTGELLDQEKEVLNSGNFQTSSKIALSVIDHYLSKNERIHSTTNSVLDPTCGTGIFLISYLLKNVKEKQPIGENIKLKLVGIERNPKLLSLTWICLIAIQYLLSVNVDVILLHADLVTLLADNGTKNIAEIDLIIGNPPWINWSDLPEDDREKWKNLAKVSNFDFIRADKMELGMGATNIDIGPLLFLLSLKQFGDRNTKFAFLFKPEQINSSSLYWYRNGGLSTSKSHGLRIDLIEIIKYTDKSNFINLEADTECIIGKVTKNADLSQTIQVHLLKKGTLLRTENLHRHDFHNPKDVFYLPSSEFLNHKKSPLRSLTDKEYEEVEIRHGLKHDCRDVFEITQKIAEKLNWECVYPTIKSRHIKPKIGWNGKYSLVIIPHRSLSDINEKQFADQFSLTYSYLKGHKGRLLERKSRWLKNKAFYTVFGVGEYSFSTYKIAWVRLGWKPYFALIEPVKLPNGQIKPVVPSDHFLFIPTENRDYAEYVVSLLNSAPYQEVLELLSSKTKSSLPKKLITRLNIPTEQDYLSAR